MSILDNNFTVGTIVLDNPESTVVRLALETVFTADQMKADARFQLPTGVMVTGVQGFVSRYANITTPGAILGYLQWNNPDGTTGSIPLDIAKFPVGESATGLFLNYHDLLIPNPSGVIWVHAEANGKGYLDWEIQALVTYRPLN